jgi:hypothetical protein
MFEISNMTLGQQIVQVIADPICTGTLRAGERG